MRGRKKEKERISTMYPMEEMLGELVKLSEEQWGGYAFYHEPLERKFSEEQKKEYTRCASECGRQEAQRVREQYPEKCVKEIILEMGFELKRPDTPTGGGHVLFAQYVEPAEITVFEDCVKKAQALVTECDLEELLESLDIEELLLAHELFHGIEYQRKKEIYTQTEKIELWRKPFSNKSRILALSELAAMAFAKEMLGISYSPYVLDVLLMYPYHKEASCALYEEILEAAGVRERKGIC